MRDKPGIEFTGTDQKLVIVTHSGIKAPYTKVSWIYPVDVFYNKSKFRLVPDKNYWFVYIRFPSSLGWQKVVSVRYKDNTQRLDAAILV